MFGWSVLVLVSSPAHALLGGDGDGDGFGVFFDCDDTDPTVYPGAIEVVADGVDQDCDGQDTCWIDRDLDGWGGGDFVGAADFDCVDAQESAVTGDCNDADGYVYPTAVEVAGD